MNLAKSTHPKRVFFKTFGCRTNIADTAIMLANLGDFEPVKSENLADVVVVNSCTVTNGADRDVKDYLAKVTKMGKKVLFTGCGLESLGRESFAKGAIFGAFGHSQKEKIAEILSRGERFFLDNDLRHLDSTIVSREVGRTRGFVKIQEGCDFKCAYCIIPQVRGRARSYPRDFIVRQVEALAQSGVSEVVLSGTNLGSYGRDSGDSLARLLAALGAVRGVQRIRLGSLEPSQIDDEFLEILGEGFVARQLHIAIQHTSDEMLRIMRRRNRFERDLALFERLATMGFALGSDFIVGHPFESAELFEGALKRLESLPLTHIHGFIYSPKSGTKSAQMPQSVGALEAKERLRRVKNLIAAKNLAFRRAHKNAQNPALKVLVENKKGEFFYGFDEFYNKMAIKSSQNLARKWLNIAHYEIKEDKNYAEI